MKEFIHLCSENRISWIFGLFFENPHKWNWHHRNPQEPRTRCTGGAKNIFSSCGKTTECLTFNTKKKKIYSRFLKIWPCFFRPMPLDYNTYLIAAFFYLRSCYLYCVQLVQKKCSILIAWCHLIYNKEVCMLTVDYMH